MGSNKQIAKNTLFLYFRMFLVLVVSLYTTRVVINTLGITDYGIFNAVGGIVLIISFLTQTITSASQRFFSYELGKGDKENLRILFNSVLIIYIILAIIIVLVVEIIGLWFLEYKMIIPEERMVAAHWVFQFSLLTFIVSILSTPYNALIIAYEDMKVYAYVSILEAVLKLGIVYLLLFVNHDKLKTYAVLMFVASAVVCFTYVGYCYRKYNGIRFSLSLDKGIYREIIGYSSWTMFGTLAGAANTQGVTLLLNAFFGPTANAAQSVGRQVGHAIQLFSGNIFTAIRPPMIKAYAEKKISYVLELFYKGSKYAFYLVYTLLLPLYLEMDFVLQLWLGEVGEYMVVFSRLTLIYVTIVSISTPISVIAQAANQVKIYHGVVDGFALLCLPISYIALRNGAGASTAFIIMNIIFILAHGIRLYILKRIIPFSLFGYCTRFLIPVFVLCCTTLVPLCVLLGFVEEGWFRFVITVILSILLVGIIFYYVGADKSDKVQLKHYIKQKYANHK